MRDYDSSIIPAEDMTTIETELRALAIYDRQDTIAMGEAANIIKFDMMDNGGNSYVYYLTVTRFPLDRN